MSVKLLWIGYDNDNQMLLESLQKQYNYQIDFSQNYDDTLERYQEGLFDFVIFHLQDLSQAKLLDYFICQIHQKQKTLVLLEHGIDCIHSNNCEYCISHRNTRTLVKPFYIDHIVQYINDFDNIPCRYCLL